MKTIIIFGNDKISTKAIAALKNKDHYKILIDCSTTLERILKIIRRKSISPYAMIKIFACEMFRKGTIPSKRYRYKQIFNNKDLLDEIKTYKPDRIILFRAGLIISKKVISLNIPLMNIHCAKIPEYGGLGSIYKAIQNKSYNQEATLHQVTSSIDRGVIFAIEPYNLNPQKSYCSNESIAYDAGIELLIRTIEAQDSNDNRNTTEFIK